MTSSLAPIQRKGNYCKYGAIASGGGALACFITTHWIIGLGLVGLGIFLFVKMIQFYAASGKRL